MFEFVPHWFGINSTLTLVLGLVILCAISTLLVWVRRW